TYPNLELNHTYGSVFDNERRKPFDYFDMAVQFSWNEKQYSSGTEDAGKKKPLNVLRVRGDLWEKPLGRENCPVHAFAISQFFDYLNNNAFEFGGQSVAATLFDRFKLSDKVGVSTRLDGIGMILGAVNSEYAKIADVANRERLREYDYGPGLGAAGQAI